MDARSCTQTIITDAFEAALAFYERYFETWRSFDCDWYVLLRLGTHPEAPELGFMKRATGSMPFYGCLMLNIVVDDVDGLHERMRSAGETIAICLDDNPWGDRGFGVVDPAGAIAYFHRAIKPSADFRRFIRTRPAADLGA